jgi:hypothetical protein
MLGHPENPPLLATTSVAVKMRAVRAISRKGSDDVFENPQRLHARRDPNRDRDDIVRSSRRREERGRNDHAPDLLCRE